MDNKDIGRLWAENYPKLADSRDAVQMCGTICRLIREKSRSVFAIRRSARLQYVLDACSILKAEFDEIEKGLLEL